MSQIAKDEMINSAITLFNEGQIKKCLDKALRAKKKYPDEPFIYNLLGILYTHNEAYGESIKNYSKAIKLNPNYFEAYNNIGLAYISQQKNNKAIQYFDRAIEINPSYAEAYNNKGNALKEKGDHMLAVKCYEKSLDLNPNYIDAITNLGIIWDLINDFTRSERYFNHALSLDPNNISVLYNLANCFYNSKDFKKSIDVCQKIIHLDPISYHAFNRIGLCFLRLKKEERAEVFFRKAITLKPDFSEGLNNYGYLLQKQRDFSLATVQFEKALKIDPNNVEVWLNLSQSYLNEGRPLEAKGIAEKGLLSIQNNIPLLKNLITSLIFLNRLNEASEACKKILSIDDNDADATNLMGTIFEKQGYFNKAKKHFLKALELNKNLVLARINILSLYQQEGQIEEAKKQFAELVEEQPQDPEVLCRMSALAIQQESFENGWRYYENRWDVFPMNKTKWPIKGKALWKGERRKRVVLWKEQGIGDQIICLSLIAEVKTMCETLWVYVDSRLRSLCKRAMPEINFIDNIEELQHLQYDYHLPLGSVPGLIRNEISDFDRTINGYLKPDPQRVQSLRNELKLAGKRVVGISWKSFNTLNQATKSIQLREMEKVFSGLDVVLVNLQYGDVEDEIKQFKEETGIEVIQCASVENREDLDGLAALIEACDLVISTSNITVHMAGALAKNTWVLLPYLNVIFWWLLKRTDSVWYPNTTLYRQQKNNDWDSVYVSIRKDLRNKIL